jgi:hypothetical protein
MPTTALKWGWQANWQHYPDSTAETGESKAASSISQKIHKCPKDAAKKMRASDEGKRRGQAIKASFGERNITAESHQRKTALVDWLGRVTCEI